jgi:hypothetical protein
VHGSRCLPLVMVDTYNVELKDGDGFLGDRASKKAFSRILDQHRKTLRGDDGEDPFGDRPSVEIRRNELDNALAKGDPTVAGLIHGAVEEFAQDFAGVVRRFLKERSWDNTERIAIGGGMRKHRVGELVIGRLGALLKAEKCAVEIVAIEDDPDDAGILGALRLAPEWVFRGHDAIVAVDIGGTNIRAGLVTFDLRKAPAFANAAVQEREAWRHSEDEKVTRDDAVDEIVEAIRKLVRRAHKSELRLAPFVGVACPGIIEPDGSIDRGTQNLPGNWQSSRFHLPARIVEGVPTVGDEETQVILHNDAVVQGLSEVPRMLDVKHWGILTLGTGLGNARFTNRRSNRRHAQ